jgi:hypothetical protein
LGLTWDQEVSFPSFDADTKKKSYTGWKECTVGGENVLREDKDYGP